MSPLFNQLPREAAASARTAILEALEAGNWLIHRDGHAFLRRHQFDPPAVVDDLSDYLQDGARLYILPGTVGRGIKYQCCLRYEDIIIHAKMSRGDDDGSDWFVLLGFHEHNTGHTPLPE